MDKTIKAKWVATLRSGNFKQARATLRTADNKCCCLGVLCDILDPNGWREKINSGQGGYIYEGFDGIPSCAVLASAGLLHEDATTLAKMNDGGKSFKQIADYIEKHL